MRGLKLFGLCLLLAAGSAGAQVTGTVTLTSDYDFRGISQSAEDPALQGSVDWAHDSGFYAGLWGSNIDFGDGFDSDVEIDAYIGFAGGDEEGFTFDTGIVYYSYWPEDDDVDVDYFEVFFGGAYNVFDAKFWYSDDYFGVGESAYYIEGNLNFELPQGIGLGVHAGISDGDAYEESITDYGVSVSYTVSHIDLELKYVDTDIDSQECEDPVFSCEGRIILSASTTFPWGAEE